jgi:hypothetical protein
MKKQTLKMTWKAPVLALSGPVGEVELDLSRALRATMFDRAVTRSYTVSEFLARGAYPFGDALKVHLVNEKEGLFIPLILRPTEDGFRATVPAGQIVEQWGMNRKLMELALFPELMVSRVGEEGFFLLPCWSGALVRFARHEPLVNRDRLYMEQEHWERLNLMNCFAMNRGGKGLLGIVHKGDFNCYVTTELNQGGENRIYPAFTLRRSEGQVIKQEDKEVVYALSSDREAEYPRMALRYQAYLVKERGVSPLKSRIGDNPVLKYATTSMRVKIFMGCKQPSLPDGSGTFEPTTSCEQAEKILDAMKAAGIERAVVTLVGWNLGGHDGFYPSRFPVEPAIGGEEALRRLIQKALGMGYQIVPHDNVTDIYRPAADWDPEYVARTGEGEMRVVGVWSGGQSYKACPVVYMDRWGNQLARTRALGWQGCYLFDAQSCVLWTCHDPRHPADEEQFAVSLASLLTLPRSLYGAVCSEIASTFSLPFVDEVTGLHLPGKHDWLVKCQSPAFQAVIDRIVPFNHIAVHGLITYQIAWVKELRQGGLRKGQLRELALGAKPCMEICWSGRHADLYADSIRDIKWAHDVAFSRHAELFTEVMTDYEELAPEAARITYANGSVVTVNWGATPVAGLAPESFRVTP